MTGTMYVAKIVVVCLRKPEALTFGSQLLDGNWFMFSLQQACHLGKLL